MIHRGPSLAVDALVFAGDSILLVKRRNPPFEGCWALPGGFVEYGETVEDAVVREVHEETGLSVEVVKLFGVYSDPQRDPRGHTVSVVFLCKPKSKEIDAGSDASEARFFPLSRLPELAFDHKKIVSDYRLLDK